MGAEEMTREQVDALAPVVLKRFDLDSEAVSIHRNDQGHINDSYQVNREDGRVYFLQRISPVAFHDPKSVMLNILAVTSFLRKEIEARGGNPERECLNLVKTKHDHAYVRDEENGMWRLYLFVDGLVLDAPRNLQDFYEAGKGFGTFQKLLAGFPSETLFETIPQFHDTTIRYKQLESAIEENRSGRRNECQPEIAFAAERKNRLSTIVDGLRDGSIPLRTTHNDTKLNNIMFDQSGKAICILDLDTVMPGSALYDFGDAIRFGANLGKEDEQDLSNVKFSLERFEAYAKGFLDGADGTLTEKEIRLFPYAAMLMTYECGTRFLADYLNGDVYFHTAYPEHNLVRARDQFALLKDMEAHEKEMDEVIASLLKKA